MIFNLIHDIYDVRIIEDETGQPQQEEFLVRKDVKSKISLDEMDIQIIAPKFNEHGRRYHKRVTVSTSTETFVLNHTFEEMISLKNNRIVVKGFKTNNYDKRK